MRIDFGQDSIKIYGKLKGVIAVMAKDKLDSMAKLSTYYTPGVASVSSLVATNKELAREYTWKANSVAVITDGSAVLGLGNIGPEAALPVMEGKCMIFNQFAGIDAVPIALDVHTEDELVKIIKAVAPSFGGINLEDIAAPICFRVEERLIKELNIPVFHDDQHGTAIVVLAGLINAAKATNRSLDKSKITIIGSGAAGTAIAKLIHKFSPTALITMIDSKGIIGPARKDLNQEKKDLLSFTNLDGLSGTLSDALAGSDIFIGVSRGGLLKPEAIKLMAKDPIIFAMANPIPEILPDEAKKAGAAIVATGRSDYPNQVNNAIVFPGIFRGALDNHQVKITTKHKLAAAKAVASLIENPDQDHIIPLVLDKRLVKTIAKVIS